MKVKETAQVPTNDGTKTRETEETEAPWVALRTVNKSRSPRDRS